MTNENYVQLILLLDGLSSELQRSLDTAPSADIACYYGKLINCCNELVEKLQVLLYK